MTQQDLFYIIRQTLSIALLIIVSGTVSAGETALFALSRRQLKRFRQSPRWIDHLVLRLRESPEALITTVLLANSFVNILLFSILAVITNRVAGYSHAAATVIGTLSFLLVLFATEILPKLFAFALRERLAPMAALPIRLLEFATWPLRAILRRTLTEPLTRIFSGGEGSDPEVRPDELQNLVNICQTEGLIDARENALLHRVMDLADMRVSELMIPRVDVVAFDLAESREQLIQLFQKNRLLRIPAYDGQIDNIRGLISAKDCLLNPDLAPAALVQPVPFIPEQARVEALLQHFRSTATKLAIVVDEYGGLAGIVALEDIVEAIIGELRAADEPATPPSLQQLTPTTYLVNASLDVADFCRAFDLPEEESRVNTVGGMIAERLDRVPHQGDRVELAIGHLEVVSVRKHRILQARLNLKTPAVNSPDLLRLLDQDGDLSMGRAS